MLRSASLAAAAVYLLGCIWLARVDSGGPLHADVVLDGGIPATVYLPGEGGVQATLEHLLTPPPPEARPPAVVLMHGYVGDRALMSGLARRIADSGYAALAFDAMGHGANRNPYARSRAQPGSFAAHFEAALEFLRPWPFVDGERIAVLGHSMGANAALDYATRDSGVDAAVLVSGGGASGGPYPPANTLFLYAQNEPEPNVRRIETLAARLAGVAALRPGETVGRHDRRSAVRVAVVPGSDHASIPFAETTVSETVAWLDAAFATKRERFATPADPRMMIAGVLLLAFVVMLPGAGYLVARLAPAAADPPAGARGAGLLGLAAALALSTALLAPATPAPFLAADLVDTLAPLYALAGATLLVWLHLQWPQLLHGVFDRVGASCLAGLLGAALLYALLVPFGPVFHRIAFTPERVLVFALSFAGFLPLTLASSVLLRRGGVGSATGFAVAGRLLLLLLLVGGVRAGVLESVLMLMLPVLTLVSLVFELFAAALYAGSRNRLVIAIADAAWLAIAAAAVVPVRL